jgi:hypothetical protein
LLDAVTGLDDDGMIHELPITNGTHQDLRLGVRPMDQAGLGPDHHGQDYSMRPGDEWCVRAPGQDVTFAVQVGRDALVILVGGCDIESVSVEEQIVGERPLLAELPPAD